MKPAGDADSAKVMAGRTTMAIVGALCVVGLMLGVGVFALERWFDGLISGEGAPSCDAAPRAVDWTRDGSWNRSSSFELPESRQVVQVDVRLGPDGGVLRPGHSVYAIPAGAPLPVFGSSTSVASSGSSSSDDEQSNPRVRVGHGVEAVNESVALPGGSWELIVRGGPGTATVRWPC